MAARRAAGTSPPRGFKGGGKGGFQGTSGRAGKGALAFGLDFPQLDHQPTMAPPQMPLRLLSMAHSVEDHSEYRSATGTERSNDVGRPNGINLGWSPSVYDPG